MSLRSPESRAYARAFLSGMVVPTLLISSFLASARATFSPAPASPSVDRPTSTQGASPKPSVAKPVAQPVAQPVAKAVAKPVTKPVTKPVAKLVVNPVAQPAAQPVLATAAILNCSAAGSSNGDSDDRDFFWALVEGGDRKRHTVGNTDERAQRMITRALRLGGGKFLYFRMDDRDYIVRDAETISAASKIVEPMEVLGRKMGELGGRQGALGGRQGALGGEQGRLGARQAELAAQQVSLAFKIRSRERRGLSTSLLEREQKRVDEAMRECSRRQSELGSRQSELGEEQSILGAEQSRYGAQMSRLSVEVEEKLRTLLRRSIESGEAMEPTEDDA